MYSVYDVTFSITGTFVRSNRDFDVARHGIVGHIYEVRNSRRGDPEEGKSHGKFRISNKE